MSITPPLAEYKGDKSFFGGTPPLSLETGYFLVLGFGVFFSVFTTVLVYLDQKFGGTTITSEQFNTAGRSVKTGLTASVIVSQWTWAATLLQSSNVAWQYGVSGPFWYASGATIQVLLFGILAIELKKKAPKAHTVCELVRARWGKAAHFTFIIFCFLANIIVTSMLLLGGADCVNALTGMNTELAGFLIPIGVILYTCAGGLKATFLASYIHTAIIFVILVSFVFTVYIKKYSTDLVYDWLKATVAKTEDECKMWYTKAGEDWQTKSFYLDDDGKAGTYACGPVADNRDGEYLTMLSGGGLMFGIINIIGNFGTVFVDQSYWQSAIAAKPASAHKGYLLGGLVWFTIPFTLATSMGLSSTALQLPITASEAGRGLVPPAVATHLFGAPGSAMIATMLFMAIVSTGSAECIAVSSIVSYDIYREYFNKAATGADILRVSRFVIVFYGIFSGVLSVILLNMGLSLGWVYLFMGIVIGSAVIPLWNLMTWDKANASGAIIAAWGGQLCGLIVWIITCSVESGEVSIKNLGNNWPMLLGNVAAIGSSGLIHATLSFGSPQNFDWKAFDEKVELVEDDQTGLDDADYDENFLNEALAWIKLWGCGLSVVLCVVWPILSVPAGVFTRDYFAFWVFVAILWGFVATVVIVALPIYESREGLAAVVRGIMGGAAPAAPAAPAESKGSKRGTKAMV
jgi:SSS family transporter